eukprot:c2221_g1_i1 orf=476-760(+)
MAYFSAFKSLLNIQMGYILLPWSPQLHPCWPKKRSQCYETLTAFASTCDAAHLYLLLPGPSDVLQLGASFCIVLEANLLKGLLMSCAQHAQEIF